MIIPLWKHRLKAKAIGKVIDFGANRPLAKEPLTEQVKLF
jgi:hypothetical protein